MLSKKRWMVGYRLSQRDKSARGRRQFNTTHPRSSTAGLGRQGQLIACLGSLWCSQCPGPLNTEEEGARNTMSPADIQRRLGAAGHGKVACHDGSIPQFTQAFSPKRIQSPRFDVADKPRLVASQAELKLPAVTAQESLRLWPWLHLAERRRRSLLDANNAAHRSCLFRRDG